MAAYLNDNQAQVYDKIVAEIGDQIPDDLNILNRLNPIEGFKVLDLGCGTGRNYTYKLAERVGPKGQVFGVDPDEQRIKVAKENNTKDNVKFEVWGGEDFPEDQYDMIFCHYVFHLVENKQLVFDRVNKNLRCGGQFAIIVELEPNEMKEEMSQMMGPERCNEIKKKLFHCSAEKYEELAIANGFIVTFKEEIIDGYYLPSIDDVIMNWYALTCGKFDPAQADQASLDKFKKKYAQKSVYVKLPSARFIFTKH